MAKRRHNCAQPTLVQYAANVRSPPCPDLGTERSEWLPTRACATIASDQYAARYGLIAHGKIRHSASMLKADLQIMTPTVQMAAVLQPEEKANTLQLAKFLRTLLLPRCTPIRQLLLPSHTRRRGERSLSATSPPSGISQTCVRISTSSNSPDRQVSGGRSPRLCGPAAMTCRLGVIFIDRPPRSRCSVPGSGFTASVAQTI